MVGIALVVLIFVLAGPALVDAVRRTQEEHALAGRLGGDVREQVIARRAARAIAEMEQLTRDAGSSGEPPLPGTSR